MKKAFGALENVPKGFEPFLKIVSDTYDHADEDRAMIERSMEISSKEMGELNEKLKSESTTLKTKMDELERMNKLMVDRELKMMELKKELAMLKVEKVN